MKYKIFLCLALAVGLLTTPVSAMSNSDAELKAKADYWLAKGWNLAEGGLTADADYYFCDMAEKYIKQIEDAELRADLWEVAHATRVELDKQTDADQACPSVKQGSLYASNARLTAYCSCSTCCGKWAGGPTASGSMPVEGRTVANGALPFGTKVIINGRVYVVEDRGVGADQFDIYFDSHSEAQAFGMKYADVYLE